MSHPHLAWLIHEQAKKYGGRTALRYRAQDTGTWVPVTWNQFSHTVEVASRALLELGVSQLSGGSRTSVGGYVHEEGADENSAQFDVSDRRSLDEVVGWLLDLGYIPSFCTACYREGRTGDRFMSLVKKGQIANCCLPNALLTLKEYLDDYASPATRRKGEAMIARLLETVPGEKVREKARRYLEAIDGGRRDFRF